MISYIVFLPLLGALIAGLFCRRISASQAQYITSGLLVVSAILSAITFYDVIIEGNRYTVHLLSWFDTGDFIANWALKVDALTAVMLVVVTSVSSLVHIYAVGYMSHDPHIQRFMSYLSLFTFFMLMLVTSDNLAQLYVGWEGVGLCSYLLIGFWYQKPTANAAAMKAFIVNRVGDFALALGVFAIYITFGTIEYAAIFDAASEHAHSTITFLGMEFHAITVIGCLLFVGCMGKSAQLGLHTWLPDAMEGPTPVSALIHAATMVTAGVFLIARFSPLLEYAPIVLNLITIVGASTALFAATIAVTQNDIKRIIAYSTCSQLGYMFFACGVSAYGAGVFHLMTHAFFKALLFLGAGSVIHAMSDEQDIRRMGGMWKHIKVTYILMFIGSLALAGIPPFAGFYSKDMILESAYGAGSTVGMYAFWVGVCAAFLTAFYSWRLIILTFHGKPRASKEVMKHVHESGKSMLIPLYILAIGAMVSGAVGYYVLGMVDADLAVWNHAIVAFEENNPLEAAHHVPLWVKLVPLIAALSGIMLAYVCYMFAPSIPGNIASSFALLYRFLLNKWYIDELYDAIFVRPIKQLGRFLWKVGDVMLIDGLGPNGFAWVSQRAGRAVSYMQTGFVYHYAFVMLMGLVALIGYYLFVIYQAG